MAGQARTIDAARPAGRAVAIVPTDVAATVFPTCRGVYVGVAGDLKVVMADGTTVVFTAAPVGYHPLQISRVFATGTAATNLVALY